MSCLSGAFVWGTTGQASDSSMITGSNMQQALNANLSMWNALPADLFVGEIPVMVKDVSDEMYANVDNALTLTLFQLLWYVPFTCEVLDDADILSLES